MVRSISWIAVLCVSVTAMGCSEGRQGPDTVSVSGKITLNGSPLADADVEFMAADNSFISYGKTDSNGQYKLIQGAVPGENKVVIKKLPEGFVNDVEGGMDLGQLEAANLDRDVSQVYKGSLVPLDYADPAKTPLKYAVPDGGTDGANFDL